MKIRIGTRKSRLALIQTELVKEKIEQAFPEAEIELVKKMTKDVPLLLLDDVLSELDSNRQNYLLNSIGELQTIITCTGLEEFVNNRFEINRVFKVSDGVIHE